MFEESYETLKGMSLMKLYVLRGLINGLIQQKQAELKTVRQIAAEENDIPQIPTGPAVEGLEIPQVTRIECGLCHGLGCHNCTPGGPC